MRAYVADPLAQTDVVMIRPAVVGEERRLAELNAIVQEMHREVAPEWFKTPDLDATTAYFGELLGSASAHVFVADVADEIQGYVLIRVRELPDTGLTYGGTVVELDQISVAPSARGTGLASALIQRVKELARDVGADRLQLTVWEFNRHARAVFEHAGFTTAVHRMVATP